MKRGKIIVILIVILLVLLVICLTHSSQNDPNAPRYVSALSQPAGPFGYENYGWGDTVPFRDGKVWVSTALSRTNYHVYLCDLNNRKVLGELFNASAAFANQDFTRLLCEGNGPPALSFKQRSVALLNRILPRKMLIPTNRIESFWILDLKNNSARRIGELTQTFGYDSTWRPAPGFRFGFNVPLNGEEYHSFFLCDLETGAFRKIKYTGKLRGWWSDHEILIADPGGNFVLFDVLTDKTTALFSAAALEKFCRDFGLPPATLTPLSRWNGTNYDFYLSGADQWGFNGQSFLLKVDKTVPTLRLFSRDFKFGYLGRMDETEKYYVYNGESGPWGRGGDGAVYLRDVMSTTTTTLVPPDNGGQYALSRTYGDSILYYCKGQLWTIKLNGSANTRLFPSTTNTPPDQKP